MSKYLDSEANGGSDESSDSEESLDSEEESQESDGGSFIADDDEEEEEEEKSDTASKKRGRREAGAETASKKTKKSKKSKKSKKKKKEKQGDEDRSAKKRKTEEAAKPKKKAKPARGDSSASTSGSEDEAEEEKHAPDDAAPSSLQAGQQINPWENRNIESLIRLPAFTGKFAEHSALLKAVWSVRHDPRAQPQQLQAKQKFYLTEPGLPGNNDNSGAAGTRSRGNWGWSARLRLSKPLNSKSLAALGVFGRDKTVQQVRVGTSKALRGLHWRPAHELSGHHKKFDPVARNLHSLGRDVFGELTVGDIGQLIVLPAIPFDRSAPQPLITASNEALYVMMTLRAPAGKGTVDGLPYVALQTGLATFVSLGLAANLVQHLPAIEQCNNRVYDERGQAKGFILPSGLLEVVRKRAQDPNWLPPRYVESLQESERAAPASSSSSSSARAESLPAGLEKKLKAFGEALSVVQHFFAESAAFHRAAAAQSLNFARAQEKSAAAIVGGSKAVQGLLEEMSALMAPPAPEEGAAPPDSAEPAAPPPTGEDDAPANSG